MNSPQITPLTGGLSHFFGFHDLTPWNVATEELVCLRTNTPEDHVPTASDVAEVVVIDEVTRRETVVGETRAWNWQKGARQRWLPALGRRVIVYNAESATGFECRLVDLDAGTTRTLPLPLYDICDHAGFGLTLNFHKLVRCQPGYGYDHSGEERGAESAERGAERPETGRQRAEAEGRRPETGRQRAEGDYGQDGIFRVELSTGETKLILSIADFLKLRGLDPALGEHYFTHIQISPDGQRFVFMHRCFLKSGGLVNHFVVANTDGSGLRVLLDDKMSHFDWKDDQHVIVWCRKNNSIKRLKESKLLAVARLLYRLSRKIRLNAVRQGIYNECFREIDVTNGEAKAVGKGVLPEDGHPQVNPQNRELWINDTYPNPEHNQTLMLYHQPSNRRIDLLQLTTPPKIQETCWRCDFHPRWHPGGQKVCFDSAHLGRRQLCTINASPQIKELVGMGLDSTVKSPSRIALFLPFLGGRGANRVMLTLAGGFAAAGHSVDLVVAEFKGELCGQVPPGVRVVDLKSHRGVLRCLPAYRRYLRAERPAIMLTAMDYVNVISILIRAVSSWETKFFVSCHTSLLDSAKSSHRFRDRLLPGAVRWTYRFADGIVAVSRAGADNLRMLVPVPPEKITTIYNPVVDNQFEIRASEPLQHPWFCAGQPTVILAVGALDYRKDFLTLIEAFARVRQRMDARLLILGEGDQRIILEQCVSRLGLSEYVSLPGFVPNPLPFMKSASLFVSSSKTEGFGLALAEALACGTPVVSTNCRFGPAEILEDGRYGRLVPVGDAQALATAMELSLKDAPERATLQRRGYEFSYQRAVNEYLRLFGIDDEIQRQTNTKGKQLT
ncbi:MAG: glycosyltransferase [Verrucomicrobiota bacterium]